jgi:hypothetical protein
MSPEQRRPALTRLFSFNVLNAVNFNIFLGSAVAVFLLRFDASNAQIGLVNALGHTLIPLALLGAALSDRYGEGAVMRLFWFGRSVAMIGILAVPFVARTISDRAAVMVGIATVFLFMCMRAIGSAGWFPMFQWLVPLRLVTSVTARLTGHNFWIGGFTSIAVASVLGLWERATLTPIWRFEIVFAVGILCGLTSAIFLYRMPFRPVPPAKPTAETLREALSIAAKRPVFRFNLMQAGYYLAFLLASTFSILYLKRIKQMPDADIVMLDMARIGGSILMCHLLASWTALKRLDLNLAICGLICLASSGMIAAAAHMDGPAWVFFVSMTLMGAAFVSVNVVSTQQLMGVAPRRRAATFGALTSAVYRGIPGLIGPLGGGLLADRLQRHESDPEPLALIFFIATGVSLVTLGFHAIFPFRGNLADSLNRISENAHPPVRSATPTPRTVERS